MNAKSEKNNLVFLWPKRDRIWGELRVAPQSDLDAGYWNLPVSVSVSQPAVLEFHLPKLQVELEKERRGRKGEG